MNPELNPQAAPSEIIAVPVIASKPRALANAIPMGTNTIVSSAIPKVAPPRAKMMRNMGIISFSLPFSALAVLPTPASTVPVAVIICMEPPTMKIKKIILAAASIPFGTD